MKKWNCPLLYLIYSFSKKCAHWLTHASSQHTHNVSRRSWSFYKRSFFLYFLVFAAHTHTHSIRCLCFNFKKQLKIEIISKLFSTLLGFILPIFILFRCNNTILYLRTFAYFHYGFAYFCRLQFISLILIVYICLFIQSIRKQEGNRLLPLKADDLHSNFYEIKESSFLVVSFLFTNRPESSVNETSIFFFFFCRLP